MQPWQNIITYLFAKRIFPTSLQFRLTLELIGISVLGVSSVTVWVGG